jgi:predicted amidohydrolase
MDKFTVACVQMRLRMHASIEEYQEDLRRFLRAADAKHARVVVFPEAAGQMLAPLLLRDMRTNLLRHAAAGRHRAAGAWDKVRGRAAGWLATALKADLRTSTAALLDLEPQRLLALYDETFSALARAQGVTLVAPSATLPHESGAIVEQTAVFGPDGALLGRQVRVLTPAEPGTGMPADLTWQPIPTEVGRLGLMLGNDVLLPEVGRLLAYQNAEVLLLQAACTGAAAHNKLRAALVARMLENQLFAAASFAVGESPLRSGLEPYSGRSVILAPHELTPKGNGVLVEMGTGQSEGLVTAEWDYAALRRLWDTSETPVLRPQDPNLAAPLLAAIQVQLQALPHARASELLAPPPDTPASIVDLDADVDEADAGVLDLDDLPLLGSVTSHWPLTPYGDAGTEPVDAEGTVEWSETQLPEPDTRSYTDVASSTTIRRDDETDEMDAVEGNPVVETAEEPVPHPEATGSDTRAVVDAPLAADDEAPSTVPDSPSAATE